MQVQDNSEVRKSIIKYNLSKQYKKACRYISAEQFYKVQLKIRQPKNKGIYQFRISRKYRAFAFKEGDTLYIFEISDHQ